MDFGWRGIFAGVGGIAFALGVAAALHQAPWASFGIGWWANTVQLVGTVVTGFGLLYAYMRATRFWSVHRPRITRFWARLWRKPIGQRVEAIDHAFATDSLEIELFRGLELDRTLPMDEQLLQVQRYINTRLPQEFAALSDRIRQVRSELETANSRSQQAVDQARAEAQAAIDEMAARLDTTQSLDLTWAIVGLFITAGGILLNYWA